MNISTRLRELLSLHGVTQVELAHALNVATSYINAVVNGKKKLPLDSLECICSYLGISMAEFFQPFSDQPPLPKHIETFRAATADLQEDEVPPLLAMVVWMRNHRISQRSSPQAAHYQAIVGEAAAGLPVYSPADWDDDRIVVPEKYADPDRFFPIRARGDSMEPRIHSGDVVIVQKDVPPENGEIALVRLAGLADDEYTIKRVYLSNGVITLRSYNPAYPPMIYDADEVRSCERVVHILHRA